MWKLVVLAAVITPWDNRETPWDPPPNVVILCIGVKVLPWDNREPTVSQQWLTTTLCVSGGIDTRMMMWSIHFTWSTCVLMHEHESDDDKIDTLIWRCMHVVVLPCLLCTSWFNYVFWSPGYIYMSYMVYVYVWLCKSIQYCMNLCFLWFV